MGEVLVATSVATRITTSRSISIPVGVPFQITTGLDGSSWLSVDIEEDE